MFKWKSKVNLTKFIDWGGKRLCFLLDVKIDEIAIDNINKVIN